MASIDELSVHTVGGVNHGNFQKLLHVVEVVTNDSDNVLLLPAGINTKSKSKSHHYGLESSETPQTARSCRQSVLVSFTQ